VATKSTSQHYIVELKAEPPGRDRHGIEPIVRLRRFLKRALRSLGLRCISVRTKETDK